MYKNIVLFGDTVGVPQMIKHLPKDNLKAIVASAVRPQYHSQLERLSKDLNMNFFIQPPFESKNYQNFYNWFVDQNFDLLVCNCYSLIIRPDILQAITTMQ